jgi:DNA-directed RNA polymerase sigma subunit (sigma70/sigma32)
VSSLPGEPDPVVAYITAIQNVPAVTDVEAATLAGEIGRGDEAAKKRLIEANLHTVAAIAWTYKGRGTPLLDLIEEGNVALVQAVERMGSDERSFPSFARRRINEAIARAAG